ncbi:MAG: Uma2 family endonuclease [Candidatus Riflebacteria bacterium]|nr:Uma2 family endonuclease [Candidatus Riflebacteria bacterium]
MPKPHPKGTALTYGDCLTWPEDERWEIIDGQAFDMTPAPSLDHQRVSRQLCFQIQQQLEGKPCEMFSSPVDLLLPEGEVRDEDIRQVVQPDIVVVCDQEKLVGGTAIRGAPDWIIEILAPSTAGKDHVRKRRLYERNGLKEYWLVSPTDRTVMVYRLADGAFGLVEIFEDDAVLEPAPLPGLRVDFARVFSPRVRVVRESPAPCRSRKRS